MAAKQPVLAKTPTRIPASNNEQYKRWNAAKKPFGFRCTKIEREVIKQVAKAHQRFGGPFCNDIMKHVLAGEDPRAEMKITTTKKDVDRITKLLRKSMQNPDANLTMSVQLESQVFDDLDKKAQETHRTASEVLYFTVINVIEGREVGAAVNLE